MEDAMLTAVSLFIIVGTTPVFGQISTLPSPPPGQLNLSYMLSGSRVTATIDSTEDPCQINCQMSLRWGNLFLGTIVMYLTKELNFSVDGLYMKLFPVKMQSTAKDMFKLSDCPCVDLHPLADMQECLSRAQDSKELGWWYYQIILQEYDLHGILAMVGQLTVDVDFSASPPGSQGGVLLGVATLVPSSMSPLTFPVLVNTTTTPPTVTTTFTLKDIDTTVVLNNVTDTP